MHIYIILSIFIILLIVFEYIYLPNTTRLTSFNNDHESCCDIGYIMNQCKINDVSQNVLYYVKDKSCPKYNGSYKQCTNNFIPISKTYIENNNNYLDKPRINRWRYKDKDDQFMVQCK